MREEFIPLIKSCGTRTVPAAETKSIGLQADAQVVMVFARHPDNFIMNPQLPSTYRDLVPSRQITVTQYLSPLTGTCKNHATATLTATN
jgi:hypothetical protein